MAPSRSFWVALMMASIALAGCAGGDDGGDPAPGNGTGTSTQTETQTGGPGQPPPGPVAITETPPVELDFYFTSDGGLSVLPPEAGTASLPTGQFILTVEPGEFVSDALTGPIYIRPDDIAVDLWFQSSPTPLVTNGVFDFAGWGGSTTGALSFFGFATAGPVVAPDTPTQVTFSLSGGDAPTLVPTGESILIQLVAGPLTHTGPLDTLDLLVGGDNPSKVTITLSALTGDPLAELPPTDSETFTGQLSNFAPTDCATQEGINFNNHAFTLGADATYLSIDLSGSSPLPSTDIDIDLFDGGTHVAGGHTPLASERILLTSPYLDGLQGKDLTLRVSTCVGLQAAYSVDVAQG